MVGIIVALVVSKVEGMSQLLKALYTSDTVFEKFKLGLSSNLVSWNLAVIIPEVTMQVAKADK